MLKIAFQKTLNHLLLLVGIQVGCLAAVAANSRGHCLGDCSSCHELIESLPRAPRASAFQHLDPARVGLGELYSFFQSQDVCQVEKLYPLSIDGEFQSLAFLGGGASVLRFLGGEALLRKAVATCIVAKKMTAELFGEAIHVADACKGNMDRGCGTDALRGVALAVGARWRKHTDSVAVVPLEESWGLEYYRHEFIADEGNETVSVLAEYVTRMSGTFSKFVKDLASSDLGMQAHQPLVLFAYQKLTELALDLTSHIHQMMDHVKLMWGYSNLIIELSDVFPRIRSDLPLVAFSTEVYGRHWDVLERLLLLLGAEKGSPAHEQPLRMAEMGVACGAIGLHLLLRFPNLQYIGADPTIKQTVRDAYVRFGERASLVATTSEELHISLPEEEQYDLVFVDGPHTYRNVRNDIEMWMHRVRPGGIIAGHDFTQAHPPLLWAVLEQRMNRAGKEAFNVGMDGVWWWRV